MRQCSGANYGGPNMKQTHSKPGAHRSAADDDRLEAGWPDEDWENRIGYLGWHLGNEVGRRWWAYNKEGFPDDFVLTVDEILAGGEYRHNQDMLDALMPQADATRNQ